LKLSDRETEVLRWTADGKSAQEIADILNVTKHTVEFHIKNAVNKLQAVNMTSAVVKALVLGLLW
jgi:LuxR family transcriptional regulator